MVPTAQPCCLVALKSAKVAGQCNILDSCNWAWLQGERLPKWAGCLVMEPCPLSPADSYWRSKIWRWLDREQKKQKYYMILLSNLDVRWDCEEDIFCFSTRVEAKIMPLEPEHVLTWSNCPRLQGCWFPDNNLEMLLISPQVMDASCWPPQQAIFPQRHLYLQKRVPAGVCARAVVVWRKAPRLLLLWVFKGHLQLWTARFQAFHYELNAHGVQGQLPVATCIRWSMDH